MLFIVSTVFPCRLVFLSIYGGMCTAIYCRQHADCGSKPYTNSLQINTTISNFPKNMYQIKQLHSLKQSQNISIESLHLVKRFPKLYYFHRKMLLYISSSKVSIIMVFVFLILLANLRCVHTHSSAKALLSQRCYTPQAFCGYFWTVRW